MTKAQVPQKNMRITATNQLEANINGGKYVTEKDRRADK